MNDRFKFRAVLKTDTHIIIAEPHYIFDNGYLVNIDDVQKPFEKKYPDDCFWEFIEEIEKQENCQEVSTDSEIIIFDSFDGLIQCTGLKDKNGKLVYEGDVVIEHYYNTKETAIKKVFFDEKVIGFAYTDGIEYNQLSITDGDRLQVIGNIYENVDLLETE